MPLSSTLPENTFSISHINASFNLQAKRDQEHDDTDEDATATGGLLDSHITPSSVVEESMGLSDIDFHYFDDKVRKEEQNQHGSYYPANQTQPYHHNTPTKKPTNEVKSSRNSFAGFDLKSTLTKGLLSDKAQERGTSNAKTSKICAVQIKPLVFSEDSDLSDVVANLSLDFTKQLKKETKLDVNLDALISFIELFEPRANKKKRLLDVLKSKRTTIRNDREREISAQETNTELLSKQRTFASTDISRTRSCSSVNMCRPSPRSMSVMPCAARNFERALQQQALSQNTPRTTYRTKALARPSPHSNSMAPSSTNKHNGLDCSRQELLPSFKRTSINSKTPPLGNGKHMEQPLTTRSCSRWVEPRLTRTEKLRRATRSKSKD